MDEFEVAEISIVDRAWRHGERIEKHRFFFGKVLPGTGLGYFLDGSDEEKRYYPLHLVSHYGIVGWFKSERAVQQFIRRIAPLADWTGEIDWDDEVLAQRFITIFDEVEATHVE